MDEMSQKVQNASSHPWILPHTQGTRSTQRCYGGIVTRRFKMQTLTCCDGAEVTSTRTTVGQFKGAMECYMRGFDLAKTHIVLRRHTLPRHTPRTVSIPVGRWMKCHRKFKTQTHLSSGVVMDIAAFKVSHSIGPDIDTTALRAARARSSSIHRGDG